MSAHTFRSASIFFLRYGVDAEWQLLDTSVRSPLMPSSKLFARGVWDSNRDTMTLPMQVEITVAKTTTVVPQFLAMQVTMDSTLFTMDMSSLTADKTTYNYPL